MGSSLTIDAATSNRFAIATNESSTLVIVVALASVMDNDDAGLSLLFGPHFLIIIFISRSLFLFGKQSLADLVGESRVVDVVDVAVDIGVASLVDTSLKPLI